MGYAPNGHCGIGTFAFEGVEERDMNREWDRTQPERSEQGCNGHGGFYKGFFSTEVPSKHFNPARRKNGPCVSSTSVTQSLKSNGVIVKKEEEPEKRKKDSVREQIRQVVTNLQDVLGGLKQVHVEMREVVEQIDRLTANIDLSEETAGITQGPESNSNCLDFSEDLRVVSLGNHRPQTARYVDEEHIILRTKSPSPIHKASVVKTNRIVPSVKQNGLKNGHPPQLHNGNHTGHTISAQETPHPHSLDPKVIIESRTQKPPPYPQNGRCGKVDLEKQAGERITSGGASI
uniref:Protein Largen n=1 Tax=Knipowitschia caucasica TaxID=637954 RepID=A0AAV2JYJ5_KNICA